MKKMMDKTALMLLLVCFSLGCQNIASKELNVGADSLPCASLDEDGVWTSSPWYSPDRSCPWIDYQARGILTLQHPLGRLPRSVLVYVSFNESGQNASLAAGDISVVIGATDTTITIENRTNERFAARVVLE